MNCLLPADVFRLIFEFHRSHACCLVSRHWSSLCHLTHVHIISDPARESTTQDETQEVGLMLHRLTSQNTVSVSLTLNPWSFSELESIFECLLTLSQLRSLALEFNDPAHPVYPQAVRFLVDRAKRLKTLQQIDLRVLPNYNPYLRTEHQSIRDLILAICGFAEVASLREFELEIPGNMSLYDSDYQSLSQINRFGQLQSVRLNFLPNLLQETNLAHLIALGCSGVSTFELAAFPSVQSSGLVTLCCKLGMAPSLTGLSLSLCMSENAIGPLLNVLQASPSLASLALQTWGANDYNVQMLVEGLGNTKSDSQKPRLRHLTLHLQYNHLTDKGMGVLSQLKGLGHLKTLRLKLDNNARAISRKGIRLIRYGSSAVRKVELEIGDKTYSAVFS